MLLIPRIILTIDQIYKQMHLVGLETVLKF